MPCWEKEALEAQVKANQAMEDWAIAVVSRGVFIEHDGGLVNLTPELVRRLGAEADRVVARYLSGIGWLRPDDLHFSDDETPLPEKRLPIRRDPGYERALARAFVSDPEKNVKTALRLVASKAKTSPHVAWRDWGISAFVWNWRVLVQDAMKRRLDDSEGEAMLEAAGIEADEAEG